MGLIGRKPIMPKHRLASAKHQEDMNHLTKEGELPWGWYTANKNFIEPIESDYGYLLQKWLDSKKKSPLDQYAELKHFVDYMIYIKKLCQENGECYDYWRKGLCSDIYIEQRIAELEKIDTNIAELDAAYKQEQYFKETIQPKLRKILLDKIRECPGILQTDLYGMFEPEFKEHIQSEIYFMDHEGIISRTKAGRSYSINLK